MDIWKSETGITDFDSEPGSLALEESERIRGEWVSLRIDLERSKLLDAFSQQLGREWAIETGIIEDLYYIDRGVTTTLIEQGFVSSHFAHGSVNKDPEYVLSLLTDQQEALEALFTFVKSERPLSTFFIRELHALMTRSQETTDAFTSDGKKLQVPLKKGDWKSLPNNVERDGATYRYCPPEQVASEMERLVSLHLEHEKNGVKPEVEAAWLHHRFAQIHPFQDGNGRIARALASLVLIRGGMFPMIVPREEKGFYLQALELADEGDLAPMVRLVGRRQEVAWSKARLARISTSEEPENLQETTKLLAAKFRLDKGQLAQRIQARVDQLIARVNVLALKTASVSSREFRRAAGIQSEHQTWIALETPGLTAPERIEASVAPIFKESGLVPMLPIGMVIFRIALVGEAKASLLVFARNAEVDETIAISACYIEPVARRIEIFPWFWPPDVPLDECLNDLKNWIDLVVKQIALDFIRT